VVTATPGSTACFGLWNIVIDKATGSVDVTEIRNGNKIINVLGFMEPPPFVNLNIDWGTLVIDPPTNTIAVDVIFTHPFVGLDEFTGFDVRGVVFGPEVTNCDGLTVIPSPEYFTGEPFGYMDGALGAPDSYANYHGLAGYKYFADGLGVNDDLATFFSNTANLDNRGKFGAGEINDRDYLLDWTDTIPTRISSCSTTRSMPTMTGLRARSHGSPATGRLPRPTARRLSAPA
jgi:hypothetical protein